MTDRSSMRIFAFLFMGFAFLAACEPEPVEVALPPGIDSLPSESAQNAVIVYSDSGKVKMKLYAVQLDRYVSKSIIVFPKGVKVDFYDDSLKVNSKLKADHGVRYEKDGKMEARRNVEVVNINNEKLNTNHLIWEEATERIYTNDSVRITKGDEVIYGDGLESNQDFTRYKILKVRGMIRLKDGEE